MFVKNQRQWFTPPLAQEEADAFKSALRENGYTPAQVLPHAGYLINLANPEEDKQMFSLDSLVAEMKRCHAFGLDKIVLHPGSHLNAMGVPDALRRVGEALDFAHHESEGVCVVLENTAGQGSTVGSTLEELAGIIDATQDKSRVGVCLDTCHAFAAGYDLREPEKLAAFLDDAMRLFGKTMLRGFHFNDVRTALGGHWDRHMPLGDGLLGWETFGAFLRDGRCGDIPIVIETPEEERWPEEVRRLLEMTRA
jgi:deoxyribonuclease-4